MAKKVKEVLYKCVKCGEILAVPSDFRKKDLADPRLPHLKEKHNIEWYKGVFAGEFKEVETKAVNKQGINKDKKAEPSKESEKKQGEQGKGDVITNALNSKNARITKTISPEALVIQTAQ
jgi:hypothetical protein